jgi:carboxymethylenebutenolidase
MAGATKPTIRSARTFTVKRNEDIVPPKEAVTYISRLIATAFCMAIVRDTNTGRSIFSAGSSDRNTNQILERGNRKEMRERSIGFTAGLLFVVALALLSMPSVASAQVDTHHHAMTATDASNSPEIVQDWAKNKLAQSPRHHEWVKVKNGNREVNSFVVYPESKKKATAVVVIHEIFGMSDWVQQLTDELAEAGYIAIAPDLLSGMGPNGGGTTEIAATGSNAVGQAIRALPPDQIAGDLNAVADYVAALPGANGKVAAGGFCWGGSTTFFFATRRPTLKAAFVFYGSAPQNNAQGQPYAVDKTAVAKIGAPVYGFYGENDMRIDATVPPTTEAMKEVGKKYDPVTYAGAGHGFMRAGEPNNPPPAAPAAGADEAALKKGADALTAYNANRKARDDAWVRWKAILAKL